MSDTTRPTLSSLTQTSSSLTNGIATFSEAVTGASITGVTPVSGSNGTQYAISGDTGTGNGMLSLSRTRSTMRRPYGVLISFFFALVLTLAALAPATAQTKLALIVANGAYTSAPVVKTAGADAGIVAETLRAAGYQVTELADVRKADIGGALRDFLDAVIDAGPGSSVFVYYSGHAVQAGGDNFLVPVDAQINTEADVLNEAFRLNDFLSELAQTPAAAQVIVLDASRNFATGAAPSPVPSGLAINPVATGMIVAFAAAPGKTAVDIDGANSLFAVSVVTQMRQPGLEIEQILTNARLALSQATQGAQVPWFVDQLTPELYLFPAPPPPTADALDTPPPAAETAAPATSMPVAAAALPQAPKRASSREALGAMGQDDAYTAVLAADRLEEYQWFVELYPDSPYAAQIWEIIDTRREQVLWRRTLTQGTRNAYWNYLKRYPEGAYAADAGRQLEALSEPTLPPTSYVPVPEPLPPAWIDEAVGIADIVPEGIEPPPPVFGFMDMLFLRRPPPPPWRRDGRAFFPPLPPPPPPPPNNFGHFNGIRPDGGRRLDGVPRPIHGIHADPIGAFNKLGSHPNGGLRPGGPHPDGRGIGNGLTLPNSTRHPVNGRRPDGGRVGNGLTMPDSNRHPNRGPQPVGQGLGIVPQGQTTGPQHPVGPSGLHLVPQGQTAGPQHLVGPSGLPQVPQGQTTGPQHAVGPSGLHPVPQGQTTGLQHPVGPSGLHSVPQGQTTGPHRPVGPAPTSTQRPIQGQRPTQQVQRPVRTQPTAQHVQRPVEVRRPTQVHRPTQVQRPVQVQRPAQVKHSAPVQRPVQVQRSAPVQRPVQVQRSAPVQRPVQVQRSAPPPQRGPACHMVNGRCVR